MFESDKSISAFDGRPLRSGNSETSISAFDGRRLGAGKEEGASAPPGRLKGRSNHAAASVSAFNEELLKGPVSTSPGSYPHASDPSILASPECQGGGCGFLSRLFPLVLGVPRATSGDFTAPMDHRHAQGNQDWRYVGEGRGRYKEVEEYSFVGPGKGTYDHQYDPGRAPPSYKLSGCWIYLCSVLCLLLTALFFLWFFAPTTKPFNCEVGFKSRHSSWSTEKNVWCCEREGIGCDVHYERGAQGVLIENTSNTTFSGTSTSTALPYDCNVGYQTWQATWPPNKIAWCCLKAQRGCEMTTTPLPFRCEADLRDWARTWSLEKKAWCCAHERVACPATPFHRVSALPTPRPGVQPFNCAVGYERWAAAWPDEKKAWCCEYHARGCPTTEPATTVPISETGTNAGLESATTISATEAQVTRDQPTPTLISTSLPATTVGPATTINISTTLAGTFILEPPTTMLLNTSVLANGVDVPPSTGDGTSVSSTATLATTSLAPVSSASSVTLPYQCDADPDGWQSWVADRKAWCCETAGRGCPDAAAESPAPPLREGGECDVVCRVNAIEASCRLRVQWLVKHTGILCAASLLQVQSECPVCTGCPAAEAGCAQAAFP